MASFVSDDLFEHHSNSTPRRSPAPSSVKKSYILSSGHEKVQPEVRHNVKKAQPAVAIQVDPELRTLIGQIREQGKSATNLKPPAPAKQDFAQLWFPHLAEQRITEIVLDSLRKGYSQLFLAISQLLVCMEGGGMATPNRHPLAKAHQQLSRLLRRLPTQDELKQAHRTWEQMDGGQFNRAVNKLRLDFTPGTLFNRMKSLRDEGVTSLSRIRARLRKCKAANGLREADDDHLLAYCENFGLKFAPEMSIKAHCRIRKRDKNASVQEVCDQLPSYVSKELGPQFSQVLHETWKDIVALPATTK